MRKNSSSTDYIAYALDESPENSAELPDGYYFKTWLPRILDPLPPTLGPKSIIWTVSHFCGVLGNRFLPNCVCLQRETASSIAPAFFRRYFRWSFNEGKTICRSAPPGPTLPSVAKDWLRPRWPTSHPRWQSRDAAFLVHQQRAERGIAPRLRVRRLQAGRPPGTTLPFSRFR